MKKVFYFLLVIGVLVLGYRQWATSGRIRSAEDIFPRYVIGNIEHIGIDNGKGNVIALSPYVHTYDYSSKSAFRNMLHYYFTMLQQEHLLNDSTIVVLPEYFGTWLVASCEKKEIYKDTSLYDAMQTMVYANIGDYVVACLQSHAKDRSKEAIFKMKATEMSEIYQEVFSEIAATFHCTIVAGSILLPDPAVKNGKVTINKKGNLYNVTAVFDSKGHVLSPLTIKKYPVSDEQSFVCAAGNYNAPIYSTPTGNLGVLICADAWHAQHYADLQKQKVNIVAVPSYVGGNASWKTLWKGYNGTATPADVYQDDIGHLTERDAWRKYAMAGRLQHTAIPYGVNVFLLGDLWDLGSDGNTMVVSASYKRGQDTLPFFEAKENEPKTGSIVNVWL